MTAARVVQIDPELFDDIELGAIVRDAFGQGAVSIVWTDGASRRRFVAQRDAREAAGLHDDDRCIDDEAGA